MNIYCIELNFDICGKNYDFIIKVSEEGYTYIALKQQGSFGNMYHTLDEGLEELDKYLDKLDKYYKLKTEDLDESSSKGNKKQYWIEVKFTNDDPAYDAINGLDNFYKYNIQRQWNSYIDDVDYEMVGDGTVRVEGDDKDFLEYLIQFISETDMDRVRNTRCSWE